jgi:DNA-binding CsgD family transcriptional regulator
VDMPRPSTVERPPRRPAPGGWESLTGAELRVVDLVAQGMRNREVAARLHLSPHTVDSHLRHAFTKLGVTSRVQLARHAIARTGNADQVKT